MDVLGPEKYDDHINISNLFQVADTQLPFDLTHR